MKKFLSLVAVLALTGVLATNAAESRLENYVNKKLSPLTQKEKEFNSKVEAQRKADEAKRAEFEKQQKERQAAYEKQQAARKAELEKQQKAHKEAVDKKKKEAEARHQARKDAFQAERDYWKSLKK